MRYYTKKRAPMKKIIIALSLVLTTLAPAMAFQYIEESGKRIYTDSKDAVYEAFIDSLVTNNFKIKRSDSRTYSAYFKATDVEFAAKVYGTKDHETVLQMHPTIAKKLAPQGVYRKVFSHMDKKVTPTQ